ncbi:hypothetical protein B0H11DRAFT_2273760 [Mycena galericulata]|nr:hypothetical protein B0H11DRAFT_2273760 [Mycena galericulata]
MTTKRCRLGKVGPTLTTWRMSFDSMCRPSVESRIGSSLSQTTRMRMLRQTPVYPSRIQGSPNPRLGPVVARRQRCTASSSRKGNPLGTQPLSIASISRNRHVMSRSGAKILSTHPVVSPSASPGQRRKSRPLRARMFPMFHGSGRSPRVAKRRPSGSNLSARRSVARSMKAAVALPSSGWPTTPALVFTNRGVLNLSAQDSRIQTLIRNSFIKINGDALFHNGFPDFGDRLKYARDGLYLTSKKLGYNDIGARLIADEMYSKEIAKVADARWTDTRRNFKTAAIPATIHAFDLKVGCSGRVQALLAGPYNDYIYPIKDGAADYSKPFGNPAIITTIHQAVFSGRRPLATVYQARFGWIRSHHHLEIVEVRQRMIGNVIACLAATAVYATLQEWQGPVHVSNEFNANLFAETYLVHLGFLEQMEERSPVAYQKILSRLYREASGQGKVLAHRAATGANALAHLNFADLEAASD